MRVECHFAMGYFKPPPLKHKPATLSCIYIYMCVYLYICTYMYIYMYLCIHMYIYIYICTSTSFKVAPQTEPRNHKLVAAHLYFRRQIYIYIYICIPLFGMLMCIIRYSICVDMRCSVLQCGRK